MSGQLPPGIGIALIGVDRVNVRRNKIENNDFYGIAVVDWCLAVGCTTLPPGDPPALDGLPDINTFVKNALANNGTNPQPGDDPLLQLLATIAADITYVVDPCHRPPITASPATPIDAQVGDAAACPRVQDL